MVAYLDFVALSESGDSEERGRAAHLAALAYVNHHGPADEQAALYAALIGFLDDPSIRVRGALAYGLLHATEAPRPILVALLHDSPVIARAVVQHSPALVDADLVGLVRTADAPMLEAAALRVHLSGRLVREIVARGERAVTLGLLKRAGVAFPPDLLEALASACPAGDAELRGALLGRGELAPRARLGLVQAAGEALRQARLVAGAVAPARLDRLLRDSLDTALGAIGEGAPGERRVPFAAGLAGDGRLSLRVLLHAITSGHVLFFAACLAQLGGLPERKVFAILEEGSRPTLNALLARCGLGAPARNLVARLILHARAADLADDVAARHYVVTAVTEELIVEHDGAIPAEIEEAFAYLSEQNVLLARRAALGVMPAFAAEDERSMPVAGPGRAAA